MRERDRKRETLTLQSIATLMLVYTLGDNIVTFLPHLGDLIHIQEACKLNMVRTNMKL